MKGRIITIILFSLLISAPSAIAEESELTGAFFSGELQVGDVFTWNVLETFDFELPDTVTIEVVKEAGNLINADGEFTEIFTEYFSLSTVDLNSELMYAFISIVLLEYENGTSIDVPEEFWIYLVNDDYYFADPSLDMQIDITTSGSYVTYDAYLVYPDGVRSEFQGTIHSTLGIVTSLYISYESGDTVEKFATELQTELQTGLNDGAQVLGELPVQFSPLLLVALAYKRRNVLKS